MLDLHGYLCDVAGDAFSESVLRQGIQYQKNQRVLFSEGVVLKESVIIRARVQGRYLQPYVVQAIVSQVPPHSTRIEGICSCPAVYNCKHLVAAIADVLDKGSRHPAVGEPRLVQEMPPERAGGPLVLHVSGIRVIDAA